MSKNGSGGGGAPVGASPIPPRAGDAAEISPARILDRVNATNDVSLTQAEVAALEAHAATSTEAGTLLGMHYFNSRQYDLACKHAERVFKAAPNARAARNLFSALGRTGRFDEGLTLLDAHGDLFDAIEEAANRGRMYFHLGRQEEAVSQGTRALELKDAHTPVIARPTPVVRPFNAETPERNVISFSLFGRDPSYRLGAVRNAIVARHLYPGWTPRFYVDSSVPQETLAQLRAEGAQIRMAPKLDAARYGLFWRFLVEDDPDVDIYLVRDADSILNIRERMAVEDWLTSGKPYHVMRDHPLHSELILAGMWGAHRGNLSGMGRRILNHVDQNRAVLNSRMADQRFLGKVLWSEIRRDALVHDAWFSFGTARAFPKGADLPWPRHVGMNEVAGLARRDAQPEL
ncbi:MAG: hypothetical protein AB3N09_12140 [Tateyamaria sp.]